MGHNRSSNAGRAAGVLGLLCAGVLSACLNPIPDDFPNGDDRNVEVVEDRAPTPNPVIPGNTGGGVAPSTPSGGGSGGEGQLPAESPEADGESPPASAAPDAGAVPLDAGGTGGGD